MKNIVSFKKGSLKKSLLKKSDLEKSCLTKSQVSMEFMITMGLMLVMFIALLSISQTKQQDLREFQEEETLKNPCELVSSLIANAYISGPGTKLYETLDYNFSIFGSDHAILIWERQGARNLTYFCSYPSVNVTNGFTGSFAIPKDKEFVVENIEGKIEVRENGEVQGLSFWMRQDDNGVEDSAGGNEPVLLGETSCTDEEERGLSCSFDGSGDYVELPSMLFTNEITVSAWVQTGQEGYVVAKDPSCSGTVVNVLPVLAWAHSVGGGSGADRAMDGTNATYWVSSSANPPNAKWIAFDLGAEKCISGINVSVPALYSPENMTIQISSDNISYTNVLVNWRETSEQAWANVTFVETQGRYVRLNITYSVRQIISDWIKTLAEFKALARDVGAVNNPPVLNFIGNKNTNENQLLQFVLGFSDPDAGDTVTCSASNIPSGANFDTGTCTFSWTPSFVQAGTYTNVNFTVIDSGGLKDWEAINVTVNNVNRAPVLNAIGDQSGVVGTPITPIVLSYNDPDGDPVSCSILNRPAWASFSAGTCTLTGTPAAPATHSNVLFNITDNGSPNLSDSESITITISSAPTNNPPVLYTIGNKRVFVNSYVNFTLLYDEPDGNTVNCSITNKPAWATFNSTTCTFNGTAPGTPGTFSNIRFNITDDGTPPKSDNETITIYVDPVPVQNVSFSLSTLNGGEFMIIKNGIGYKAINPSTVNDNEWHHMTATYDGSKVKLYIDGVLVSSIPAPLGNLPSNIDPIFVGRKYDNTSAQSFLGSIADVRIYNRALQKSDVYDLYESYYNFAENHANDFPR